MNRHPDRRHDQMGEPEGLNDPVVQRMAAGFAHEINNPLAAIMGLSQLALRRDLDPSARRDIQKILEQASRTAQVVMDLAAFARSRRPQKMYLDLVDVVTGVLASYTGELREGRVEVITRFGGDAVKVMADRQQIERTFRHIVTNACQAMDGAHGRGTLRVEASRLGDLARVSFSDDGPGLSEEQLLRISDPFFTTKDVGTGVGLGLSVCQGIVQEHGGSIWAESKPGVGVTMIVELPALGPAPLGVDVRAGSERGGKAERMRVLVADDEPALGELLDRFLSEEGYAVDVARTGNGVLQLPDLSIYHLILLDIKLPDLAGDAVFDHIRARSEDVSSRVVFITGDSGSPETAKFLEDTGNIVLAKPFSLEELLSVVHSYAPRK